MTRSIPTFAAAALLLATIAAAPAGATSGIGPAHGFVPRQAVLKLKGADAPRTIALRVGGAGVRRTVAALNRDPRVAYAAPNYVATASATPLQESGVANDPGPLTTPPGPPGGWVSMQWSFLPWEGTATATLPVSPGGIDAVGAWRNLVAANRPGASGVTVAVLDTGIAYRDDGSRFRRSPDFAAGQFVPGYDFVGNDRLPLDENGHGTHVAGTIAEKTNNGIALVGLAYRAKLMPVRVLDRNGSGEAVRLQHNRRGDVLPVMQYFDAATAARHIQQPTMVAAALFDPAVPPPGQFAVYNAIPAEKKLFVKTAGHFAWPGEAEECQRMTSETAAWLAG